MTRTDAQKNAVNRYYQRNSSDIISHKTLRMVRERGRVPREVTIESHSMDRLALQNALIQFQKEYPESRAARRIEKYLCGVATT